MKIILICNLGMSSGLLGEKLKEAATKSGIEADVEAIPMNEIEELDLSGVDCVLISPQVRYMKNDVEKMANGSCAVLVMDSVEFGLMQADKIMDIIIEAVK